MVYTAVIVSVSIVIVGPREALPALRERLDSGAELHAFSESDALEALDHIIRHKPRLVAVERVFAATPRGVALINRLKADPALADCELRIVARETTADTVEAPPPQPAGAGREQPIALDQHGTRRAGRTAMADGVDVLIDGNPATLVELSVLGAQVVSIETLEPNQRVRVTLSDARGSMRCEGAVVWVALEMPTGSAARYRAGIEFKSPDVDLLAGYIERQAAHGPRRG